MKKQQKLRHQSPSRKSRRLSSSSSAKPGTRSDDAWALSLHVDEHQPLQIRYPSPQENAPIRRSSRVTNNKYKTPSREKMTGKSRSRKILGLVASQLRRSPRLFSPSSAPALTLADGGNVGSGSRKRRRCSEEKQVPGRVGKTVEVGGNNGSLRRSLRLCGGKDGNSSPILVALPEPGSSKACLSVKSLRSRSVLMHVGDEKGKSQKSNTKKNIGDLSVKSQSSIVQYASIESPQVPQKREVKSAFTEKSLRSRTVTMFSGLPKDLTEKSLRSRTVKMFSGLPQDLTEKSLRSRTVKMFSGLPQDPETRVLRRKSNRNVSQSPELDVLSLPESVEMQLQDERVEKNASGVALNNRCSMTPKPQSSLDEPFHVSEKRDKEVCGLEGVSEKCLRSRKIKCTIDVDKSVQRIKCTIDVDKNAQRTPDPIGNEHASKSKPVPERREKSIVCCFIGEPIPEEIAQKRWQWRYDLKNRKKGKGWKINADEEDEIILNVDCHYAQARVGSFVLDIGDCVFVKGEGTKKHIGRILEFFKTTEEKDYFRVQWFFRAKDTVLKDATSSHDKRRLFYSTLTNDNILDCIISKVNVVKIPASLDLGHNPVQSAAFYYDMEYCVDYSTFRTLVTETSADSQSLLLNTKHTDDELVTSTSLEVLPNYDSSKQELALLDLYSGCGGMSTGLCLGAKLSSVNLVTKWAVDYNSSACDSLKLNHPETKVRNEPAEDFLELLRQWENLCKTYVSDLERTLKYELEDPPEPDELDTELSSEEEYEVSSLLDVCYGDPSEEGKRGLHFKVRWKGYGPDEDTWESIEGLSNCKERIQDFVRKGFSSKILPLPGDVDVICGGPPCQGISGYNRFRNFDSPLSDERNRQIVVFMDIVEFLKPRYVLMENVVDIIRFDKGSLGRYALSRLVLMKYQARLGTIASGCYGLPQFRLRVFIWGARPSETLPQFPLPSHDVVVRYWPPIEFERNIVAYDEGQPRSLEDAIVLRDSISDLPAVENDETREEMVYEKPPETEFQKYIRLSKDEMNGVISTTETESSILYDHRPMKLSEDDYLRVLQIPHRKGANFRDLPGVIVGEDNVARRDPTKEPVMLPTGKPLIQNCVLSFEQGKSRKPYARLWWDETVSTIVTFPHVRAQALLHPEQDRLLTIRECARLQGFPDYYRFCGTTKERYCQIGNAVSVPVARALGYALGMAYRKVIGDEPLMRLPPKFSSELPRVDEMVVLRR